MINIDFRPTLRRKCFPIWVKYSKQKINQSISEARLSVLKYFDYVGGISCLSNITERSTYMWADQRFYFNHIGLTCTCNREIAYIFIEWLPSLIYTEETLLRRGREASLVFSKWYAKARNPRPDLLPWYCLCFLKYYMYTVNPWNQSLDIDLLHRFYLKICKLIRIKKENIKVRIPDIQRWFDKTTLKRKINHLMCKFRIKC